MKSVLWRLAAILFIVVGSLVAYREVLIPADELARFPWGSDTWGHLIKVEYLRDEIGRGNLYPNIFPHWYAGVQLFRYYAPLPYYVLLAVLMVVQDSFLAASWFVYLCALMGGLSFLLFERWTGLFPATLGGLLFTLLPDNARVAFAEGNLPRALASALLPLAFYFLMKVADRERQRRAYVILLAVTMSTIVLSHAMMGAIFFISLSLFTLFYLATRGTDPAGFLRAVVGLFLGLALSGWWLIPSLTGGITELDQSAMSEALAHFPFSVSFNPWIRLGNPEAFYIGLGLGLGAALGVLSWGRLGPPARALLLAGAATTLVTASFFNPAFNSLPFHHLFWPIRFTPFASFALLLAFLCCWKSLLGGTSWHRAAVAMVLVVLALDLSATTALIRTRPADDGVVAAADKLRDLPGWRVSTLDLSLLGSSPTYWLSLFGNREQVYGWGYQGARIASNVSSINFAMERGYLSYALDRMEELGTDDLLVLKPAVRADNFDEIVKESAFQEMSLNSQLTLYHKDGVPRAFTVGYHWLGIGSGSQNLAYLFPSIALGHSPNVDDYDLAYLTRFKGLALSRFAWRDKGKAEGLIKEYAGRGGTVLVDLMGSPIDALSRSPKFLDVYGERLEFVTEAVLERDGEKTTLAPFSSEGEPWQAYTPQGLDKEVTTFSYFGQRGVALGYKDYGAGRVWFVGLNLPFHALLTGDTAAIHVLEEAIGMRSGILPTRGVIRLRDYRAGEDGYSFSYDLEADGDILVPVAAHEGTVVRLDSTIIRSAALNHLVSVRSPAGHHQITISFAKTTIHWLGLASTGFSVIVTLAYGVGASASLLKWNRRNTHEYAEAASAY